MKFVRCQSVFNVFSATQEEIELMPKEWILPSKEVNSAITLLGNEQERDFIRTMSNCSEDELYADYYRIEVKNE
jgi:hypothetical protein